MSEQPSPSQQGPDGDSGNDNGSGTSAGAAGRRRLGPRPLQRPDVDPGQAAVFSRPGGVGGAFDPHRGPDQQSNGIRLAAPPPEALIKAFSRPQGSEGLLQRPPGDQQPLPPQPEVEPVFWTSQSGPDAWRNPGAGAVLGPPALATDTKAPVEAERAPGSRLSLRELLFDRRVAPSALIVLLVVTLAVGAVGGVLGRLTAEGANPLNDPDATLSQVSPGKERPDGSLANLAKKVLPSVVSIEIRTGTTGGAGSGVVIDGKGYVLTNNHVVEPAANVQDAKIEVVFFDGKKVPARIVGRDPKSDLAVVKVEVDQLVVIQLGKSAELQVGDRLLAIGNPRGLAHSVSEGIVSGLNRPTRVEDTAFSAIQTDAAINPGNSGGALVDSTGALVGINTLIKTASGGSEGLGFAIPIDFAKGIAEELIRSGQVKHAELGVNTKSVGGGTTTGARVENVVQNSAAADAGIAEGDVITKIGNRDILESDAVLVEVRQHKIGEKVSIELVRQGRPLKLDVTLKAG